MKLQILFAALAIPIAGGIVGTRLWVKKRERDTIATRLARWAEKPAAPTRPKNLLKKPSWSSLESLESINSIWQYMHALPGLGLLRALLLEAGMENKFSTFVALMVTLLISPILLAYMLGFDTTVPTCLGVVLFFIPVLVLKSKANARCTKFAEQLPDAIDLMVAVLRSGHSVPQAVQAVGQEIPNPCGEEFEAVLHRINLGQPLSEALISSAQRFRSSELDLIRRAVAIQIEIGGSLAELLEKTNGTLRDRLKLARQLKVITAQSRLSAQIVGILPIILAVGLNSMNPGYLQLLLQDQLGRTLLVVVIILQFIGIYLMKRMSTMKV